ncbi:MAG: bleomycin resistance protein [Flavobacteriales bacterium]|nr:bleomycin resistance protein [Flavobacteriales bacterium]NNK80381.1 bleomycin resistance protein [Flavobacteriales bacterium]
MNKTAFHLSLPCYDIDETRQFYVDRLGFKKGRSSENWIDIDILGNQITFLKTLRWRFTDTHYKFEGQILPAFHFGVLVDKDDWIDMRIKCLNDGLCSDEGSSFLVGKKGQHSSLFVEDPNGYMIEFKSFDNPQEVFMS